MFDFKMHKSNGLDEQTRTTFYYERKSDSEPPFRIIAERSYIILYGEIKVESDEDLQYLAKVIGEAWKHHLSLIPKIVDPNSKDYRV